MIVWNVNKLAVALRNKELSEWKKTQYYIATLFLQMLIAAISNYFFSWGGNISAVVATVIGILLSYFCIVGVYQSCQKHEELSVLEALIVLGFPVSIKLQLFYWGAYLVMLWGYQASMISAEDFTLVFLLLMPVYIVMFFLLINHAINQALE